MSSSRIPTLVLLALLSGCAANSTKSPDWAELVADWPRVTQDIYPVWINNVDGKNLVGALDQKVVRISPGNHTVTVTANLASARHGGRSIDKPGRAQPGKLEIAVRSGYRYYLGAQFKGGQYSSWEPVVWKSEPMGRD